MRDALARANIARLCSTAAGIGGTSCSGTGGEAGTYVGGRTRQWLNVKVRREGRFIVVGVTTEASSALVVAARQGRRLVYARTVEWGVGRRTVEAIRERALGRATARCEGVERRRGVVWVEPRVVAQVSYADVVVQGRLRDPVLRYEGGQ